MSEKCGLVAVGGRPNVGKSTLFNGLLGKRQSITTHKRNTTRFCIRGIINEKNSQLVLVDTPGWQRKRTTQLNRALNKAAANAMAHVDAGLLVVESLGIRDDDRRIAEIFDDGMKVACAINKADLKKGQEAMLPIAREIAKWRDFFAIVPVSAKTGSGLEKLKEALLAILPEGQRIYPADAESDKSESFFVAEIIREKIYLAMADELPYSAVVDIKAIEDVEDKKGGLVRVIADIVVDSKSRQAMFIGARGQKVKEIGTKSRMSLELRLGIKVHLDLRVKVQKNWTREPATLARLALQAPQ